jgi:hypothetical protein
MRKIGGVIATCLMAAVIGCSAVYDVNYYYDKSAVFPKWQTFDWQRSITTDEFTAALIRNAVNARLTAKGFRLTSDSPDFLIMAHVTRQEKSRSENWDYSYYNIPHWGMPSSFEYEVETLSLDVVSAASQKLLWRGSANADIDAVVNPETKKQLIDEAVKKILKHFPPAQPRENTP